MKKPIRWVSVCLIAVLFSIPFFRLQVAALSASDAAQKGPEVYSAWHLIQYDSYDYYVNEFTNPYRLWVDELQEEDSWNQLLLGWRFATFDITSEYEYVSKELGYYTTFMFNILYDSTTSSLESSFIQALSDGAGDLESSWKSIGVSTWSKVSEACKGLTKDTVLAESDPEQLEQLTASLNNIEGISRALKSVNQIGDWLSYCTTAIDAVEKISKVEALLMCSDETAEIVEDLRNRADFGSPMYLVLDDFCTMLSGLLSPDMIKAILVGDAAADEVCKEMTSMLWKEVLSLAGSYGLIIQAGQSVGKFTANMMFNTSSTIAEYYKLEAMYRLEDLIRAETISCQWSFENSPSAATAKKFIASYKLFCKTLLEGLDCSLSFFDAAMKEGLAAKVSYWFNSDELDSIRSNISDIKRYLQESYDYMDTNSYNAYLYELEYLAESGTAQPPATEELQAAPLPVVELDLPAVTDEIRADVFTLKSTTITEDTTLTTDLETYGEMTVSKGTLDLNGHTLHVKNDFYLALDGKLVLSGGQLIIDGNLYIDGYNYAVDLLGGKLTVAGDVLHSYGYITLNKGSMTVSGDYRMQGIYTNSAQETVYTSSPGRIYLQYAEDLLRIEGDWICDCDFPSSFPPTCTAGRIELLGDWKNMSHDGPSCSGTNTLALVGTSPQRISLDSSNNVIANLEVGEGTDVTWSGYLDADRLTQDAAFSSDGAVITGLSLDGHALDITGDVTIHGNVDCLNGTLEIDGNLLHSNGTIALNKGAMTVSGDYRMQGISTNSAQETVYTTSSGNISMKYEGDFLRIEGDWICDCDFPSSSPPRYTAGRIELLGNWKNMSYDGPSCSGTNTLALVGTGPQRISLDSSNNVIANLEVGEGTDVTWSGYLDADRLTQNCAITSDEAIITGLSLDGHTLDITGDVTIGGHVDCLNGKLGIDGNLLHSQGTITLNKGAMTVSGDYRMQGISTNSAQETIYVSGYGSLVMQYEEDSLQVDGDMYIQGSSNTLKGGTLGIRGNFTHISGSFAPSGNHTTVLNGTGDRQVITFSGSSNRFNILELTRDGTYYLFSPDPCWNALKESEEVSDIPVTNLSISARAKTLTAGQQYQLTAVVSPATATDPSLRWSSSQEEVATVDDTGLVTAVAPGSAVIRVETSNGLYRTCTITVNELFSGILEVGSCGALPGEQLRLPVRVYDNP
ncbi:Ig-like domain-containing protein, partial [uncultured Flavonifractor sp.]|uniref:Ig-like domain-containing protein n=1 Tax=uncultured Flavonifractor sp. TaxID=1193534 RepID=UPI0026300967